MRARKEVLAGLMAALVAFAVARAPAVFAADGSSPGARRSIGGWPSRGSEAATLRIFYTNPTLVRAGERVLMPVDVVCATAEGHACRADVTLGVRVGDEGWGLTAAASSPYLKFDLTGPARRAIEGGRSGAVDFFIRAAGPAGATASLGGPEAGRPLRFFVTRDMAAVDIPEIPFGRVRRGRTQVYLPWGSGPMRAGLSPGLESATVGPSSFDVDGAGRVVLADGLQDRVARFLGGRLLDQAELPIGTSTVVAAAPGGRTYAVEPSAQGVVMRALEGSTTVSPSRPVAQGTVSEAQVVSGTAFVRVLPLDAWVPGTAGDEGPLAWVPGLPTGEGQLVRIGLDRSVRVATIRGDRVVEAFELRSRRRLGEVALARPDGDGGYVLAVHVARDEPDHGDQFQVIHLMNGRIAATFAVASDSFTDMLPLARFRLGPEGAVYQMKTFPDGLRIVRFDLGEDR